MESSPGYQNCILLKGLDQLVFIAQQDYRAQCLSDVYIYPHSSDLISSPSTPRVFSINELSCSARSFNSPDMSRSVQFIVVAGAQPGSAQLLLIKCPPHLKCGDHSGGRQQIRMILHPTSPSLLFILHTYSPSQTSSSVLIYLLLNEVLLVLLVKMHQSDNVTCCYIVLTVR